MKPETRKALDNILALPSGDGDPEMESGIVIDRGLAMLEFLMPLVGNREYVDLNEVFEVLAKEGTTIDCLHAAHCSGHRADIFPAVIPVIDRAVRLLTLKYDAARAHKIAGWRREKCEESLNGKRAQDTLDYMMAVALGIPSVAANEAVDQGILVRKE